MQIFHTALEVVCDGLHVLIDDPYGPNIGVQYRLPNSNDYYKVSSSAQRPAEEAIYPGAVYCCEF